MTLNELSAATGLTASDLIAIWDAEASGSTEPTQKLTAQQLAAAVKALANLIGTSDMDSTPTTGSTNPVTSGGVANAIAQSTATINYDRYSNSNNTCVYRVGKLCFIACLTNNWYCTAGGAIKMNSASGTEWVISSGFRPVANVEIVEANQNKRITIKTDGTVTCNEALSGVALRFSGCFICA